MPASTATFRNMKVLNIIFLLSAGLLLLSTFWLVVEDDSREFDPYQLAARAWEVAMTEQAQQDALAKGVGAEIDQLNRQIDSLQRELGNADTIKQIESRIAELTKDKGKIKLDLDIVKGELRPKEQLIERAAQTALGDDPQLMLLRQEYRGIEDRYNNLNAKMVDFDLELEQAADNLVQQRALVARLEVELREKTTALANFEEKFKDFDSLHFARDLPLLSWTNPTLKPLQDVVPAVQTDLNVVQVETIDRCRSCHVNIDNPKYEENNFIAFLERQLADSSWEKQPVAQLTGSPVSLSMLSFWRHAAERIEGAGEQSARLAEQAVERINTVFEQAGLDRRYTANQLDDALAAIAGQTQPLSGEVSIEQAYAPLRHYRDDLVAMIRSALGDESFALLKDNYRHQAVAQFNQLRKQQGRAGLSDSPVLLGHPQIDLFVSPDSKHPIKTMGCTVCHEGAGMETQFEHTAHSPRGIWVDSQTGAPVPSIFVSPADSHGAEPSRDHADHVAKSGHDQATIVLALATDVAAPASKSADSAAHGVASASDVYLTDPNDPNHPFQPNPDHATTGIYVDLLNPDQSRQAVRQDEYWRRQYGWRHIHYMHWEKPMHSLDYVESGCSRCHSEIYDIADEAPRLFEGRKLFAQVGCINCHSVPEIDKALDVKQVGPSLVHIKEKLHPDMISSWVWSPRAFRPSSRMPHYFMLENNSDPLEIRRTRTEVAAITYYLLKAKPKVEFYRKQYGEKYEKDNGRKLSETELDAKPTALFMHSYELETLSQELASTSEETIARGKALFSSTGCMACHMNLEDQSKPWLVQSYASFAGLSQSEAEEKLDAMSYNERHWAAQASMGDKLNVVGPELSAVGSKLLAGRATDEQGQPTAQSHQQAKTWLYNWLRQPRHHSSYTIMPSFRLSDADAAAISDYLLSLRRDDYQADVFLPDLSLDSSEFANRADTAMVEELVTLLKSAGSTLTLARADTVTAPLIKTDEYDGAEIADDPSQMFYLGQKMIAHYGCSGCHRINGFEDATSACTTLEEWGFKDPHKLDFGYLDTAVFSDAVRGSTKVVNKVAHEGLGASAPQLGRRNAEGAQENLDAVQPRELAWEQLHDMERRPWLYHKLHNPRVYDRGKTSISEALKDQKIPIGRPYDKLKMPKFFLTDDQVQSLVTYVTSIRKPLVSEALKEATYPPDRLMLAHGRQTATVYNCYGCHNIEGDEASIHKYFGVYNADGSYNDNMLNWAPPRLVGQGAKTQPDWLFHFLQHVNGQPNPVLPTDSPAVGEAKIRPWLNVRMPSFPLDEKDAGALVDYFAGHARLLSAKLREDVQIIDRYLNEFDARIIKLEDKIEQLDKQLAATSEGDAAQTNLLAKRKDAEAAELDMVKQQREQRRADWPIAGNEAVRRAMGRLKQTGEVLDLVPNASLLLLRDNDADYVKGNWIKLYGQIKVLVHAFDTPYPYIEESAPVPTAADFARGQGLFKEMNCTLGECHRIGDPVVLEAAGYLSYAVTGADAETEGDMTDEGYGEEEEGYGEEEEGYGEADEGYGEEDEGYGDEEGESTESAVGIGPIAAANVPPGGAPNLALTHNRLQRRWVEQWVIHAPIMQPGTRMLAHFVDGEGNVVTYFNLFASLPEMKKQKEQLFGYTVEQQQKYLFDFLYSAGSRNLSYSPSPEVTLLNAATIEPVELSLLEPPAVLTTPDAAPTIEGEAPADGPAVEAPAPVVPEAPRAAVKKSLIADFHDEPTKPHAGSRIIGYVKLDGAAPRRKPIRMSADAACQAQHPDRPALQETLIVTPDKGVQNVVVFVSSGLSKQAHPAPAQAFLIDQVGCVYTPHVAALMVGQDVLIRNSDGTMHNVNFKPTSGSKNAAFNVSQPAKGMIEKKKFNDQEKGARFSCQVHPWMGAYVHVFDHPYFFVTDVEGKFKITGLAPGSYKLTTWHETGGGKKPIKPVTIEVTVQADTSHRADVTVTR